MCFNPVNATSLSEHIDATDVMEFADGIRTYNAWMAFRIVRS